MRKMMQMTTKPAWMKKAIWSCLGAGPRAVVTSDGGRSPAW
jgi:hypothetical protein